MDSVSRSFITAFANRPVAMPPVLAPQSPAPKNNEVDNASLELLTSDIVLVSGDAKTSLAVHQPLFDHGYREIQAFDNVRTARRGLLGRSPDLILLDIETAAGNEIDFLRELRTQPTTRAVPILALCEITTVAARRAALESGATDFINKPVDAVDLLPRVRNTLTAKRCQNQLARQSEHLVAEVQRRTAELEDSREDVIHCLGRAAEFRDDSTGRHVVRVGKYVAIIARELGFTEQQAADLELVAQLHDVGKIGVPDAILNHPGRLNKQMYEVMQTHCEIARGILMPSATESDGVVTEFARNLLRRMSSPLLAMAAQIAYSHHEWFNGNGYPLGLTGEQIPIEGRITAVADVFDALSSPRPYKPSIPLEKCFDIMEEERCTHFDPRVLDAFMARREEIVRVRRELSDND